MNRTALLISDLNIYYNSKEPVIRGINIDLQEGDFISIIGPNGSGKTTLIKTILGVHSNYKGNIEIYGKKIENIDSSSIGYVPQVKTLDRSFPAKVYELVNSGLKKSWSGIINKGNVEKIKDILTQLNSENLYNRRLSELSGGELQRIYLARALIKQPKILILDEPATGIDFVCEIGINEIIEKYNKTMKTTIIMVTHDISSAYEHTEKVLMLNKSQIYYGDVRSAFNETNLQATFSHGKHSHSIIFGIKKN